MTLRQPRKGDWTGGKEDGWRSGQKAPQMSKRAARVCNEFSESVGGISTRRGKLHRVRHPDRCCGHCHALTERQRRCEKLMCPTSSSCAERDGRFSEKGTRRVVLICCFFPGVGVFLLKSFSDAFGWPQHCGCDG